MISSIFSNRNTMKLEKKHKKKYKKHKHVESNQYATNQQRSLKKIKTNENKQTNKQKTLSVFCLEMATDDSRYH